MEPVRGLFDNPVVGACIVSAVEGGSISRANRVYQQMMGYSQAELQRMTLLDLTHSEDRARTCDLFEQLVRGQRDSFQRESRWLRKDGGVFWGRLTAYLASDTAGASSYAIGLVEDITDRKRMEQERLESAERLEALLDAAVDAIVTIDSRGIIESVNPATEKMFGYSADELLGENVRILMPEPYRDEHDGYIDRYRRTGEKRIIGIGREVQGRRKDGFVFPVDLAVNEVCIGDERLFMGTLRDLTDRRILEESLLRAQKMEALGRLAGGVAHDFNTLLGTIIGYAEILGKEAGEEDSALQGYAERIHQAARRGADLTRQLLAFGSRQETRRRLVDIGSLTGETADMIHRLIGEDIRFECSVEDSLGPVAIDPGQLQQVLLNLAVNASDAMPRGGRLSVRWTRAMLDEEMGTETGSIQPGTYALLEVEDTGTGMSEANRQRIFEPFFTTKEVGKGTGLGLSTVFGIVHQWDGGISVISQLGVGTTFRIYLPVAEEGEPPSAAASQPELPSPSATTLATVLVVEDDDMFRNLLGEVLESEGYEVLTAREADEALNLCGQGLEAVDVLVSDLVMPSGNGVKLSAELRSRYPHLRVILMSGYSDEALAGRDIDKELADAFLEKPFDISTLLRTVGAVLDRRDP
ncbi:MAG: PAS domain S-box protein [Acidobacteriota bacterium]|nr:PAS domain S-box protein [Acidobacteriota bacterium]